MIYCRQHDSLVCILWCTQVDEISAGCHGSWVDMMYGRKYTLQLVGKAFNVERLQYAQHSMYNITHRR
jgi:hypothetical protein